MVTRWERLNSIEFRCFVLKAALLSQEKANCLMSLAHRRALEGSITVDEVFAIKATANRLRLMSLRDQTAAYRAETLEIKAQL